MHAEYFINDAADYDFAFRNARNVSYSSRSVVGIFDFLVSAFLETPSNS